MNLRSWLHRWMSGAAALTLGLLGVACSTNERSAAPDSDGPSDGSNVGIAVAAASDLRPAFEEIGAAFTAQTGAPVTFSFGSSGQLRQQIINGAPFDLFASANEMFVDEVIASGRGIASSRVDYSFGRIVMWAAPGMPLPQRLEDLADSKYRRIVIANPQHAPYGMAATQALEAAGVDDETKSRLVYGENVSDAFAIAKSGNADVAIVALSLVIADGSDHTLIPAKSHDPLRQTLVVTSTGESGRVATEFAAFVASPNGRTIMAQYGFTLPPPAPAADDAAAVASTVPA